MALLDAIKKNLIKVPLVSTDKDGIIEELAPEEALNMPDQRDGPRENVVPAKIRIAGVDMLAKGWKPGQPVVCEVKTGFFR